VCTCGILKASRDIAFLKEDEVMIKGGNKK
jgi:hypothetical protein